MMTGYALLKNNTELISMFKNESNALDQLSKIKENRTYPEKYTLKKINISGNSILNNMVFSIFKETGNNRTQFQSCFCTRKDAENKIKTLDNGDIYIDVYFIEEHPIFD